MRRDTFWNWACFSLPPTQEHPALGLNISWGVNETGYSELMAQAMKELLIEKGFDAGEPDGLLGPTTRSALREFQIGAGLVGDGFPDRKTLTQLGIAY